MAKPKTQAGSKSKAPAPSDAPSTAGTPAPFVSGDSAAAYNHFLPIVAKIDEADLEAWNGDADLVLVNVTRAVAAVEPHLDGIHEVLPRVKVHELRELPALARALGFAVRRVVGPASKQEIAEAQARLRPLRAVSLLQMEVLAHPEVGKIPSERVKAIRTGNGAMDEANDAVDLAALYGEFEAQIAGLHSIRKEQLEKLKTLGEFLISNLTPAGAAPVRSAGPSEEARVRDRFWTLVIRRYDELYGVGVQIWGRRKVDQHIPALLARAATTPAAPVAPPQGGGAPQA